MTRVAGGGLTRNPFGTVEAAKQKEPTSAGEQLEQELFGKKRPPLREPSSGDEEARLALCVAWVKKLARFMGDDEGDYGVRLASKTIAMIDATGIIYVGHAFLAAHHDEMPLVVGVLAHEVGHRPKRWAALRAERPTSRDEVMRLSRLEETRADYAAGRALAAFGLDSEPLCAFLLRLDTDASPRPPGQHAYFPAATRADVIREGFVDERRQRDLKRSMFPELAKLSGRHDLGMG